MSIHFAGDAVDPNPNNGDLPSYVVVDFPHYNGPSWHKEHPTYVPIPLCQETCNKRCCQKQFVPLQLCFATTIHKVQGLSIGPRNSRSDPANPAEMMVVDVGNEKFEKNCPGTFYVALSRATTMGRGDVNNSAIYFTGPNLILSRLFQMGCKKNTNLKTVRMLKREAWVKYLDSHVHDGGMSVLEKYELFEWATTTRKNKNWLRKRCRQTEYTSCVD